MKAFIILFITYIEVYHNKNNTIVLFSSLKVHAYHEYLVDEYNYLSILLNFYYLI